jgi:translation initiation factor IF-2
MKKEENNERPPIVVVLGHVDHGKSSLLEAVKDLKITEKEAGGITQHIGAYVVSHGGKDITFIDTPGHEAFFAMRSRGTKIADIGILVVAADESIKEQTKEAIEHLKKSNMPFIIAINKIDKKSIDIEKVKQDLSKEEVFVESYGGSVPSVNVSAKEKTGIEDLLEMILLLAEVEGIKDEEADSAEGAVIEVKRDSKRGIVVTLLIKKGILKKGDVVATECSYGKIKTMEDFLGKEIEIAGPSIPVQIIGIKDCPKAGESFFVFQKPEDAKKFISNKPEKEQQELLEDKETLHIIIKADVMGSLEAIENSLKKIPQKEINIKIVRGDVGNITESDIECLKMANAKIYSFRTKVDKNVEKLMIRDKIEIDSFDIIYELIEKVKSDAEALLEDEIIKTEIAKVKILAVFRTLKNRQILGGKVLKGDVKKGSIVEIYRGEEKKGEGKLINIKKEEKDVEKIIENEEFGMLLESKEKAEEGDVLVLYKEEKIKKTL